MRLDYLFENSPCDSFDGSIEISDICYDSRKAFAGCIFVCISGYLSDGHDYARQAYDKGVRVFAAQYNPNLPPDAVVILYDDTRRLLAELSVRFFGTNLRDIKIIAVTGTKGKTSTSFFIKSILEESGIKTGIIGNLGAIWGDKKETGITNTPESYELNRIICAMHEDGCRAVVFEASSQAFMLKRTHGIHFDIGIFTNLYPDHIGTNEHKNFEDYMRCKKIIFDQSDLVILNKDFNFYNEVAEGIKCPLITYSTQEDADYIAYDISAKNDGKSLFTEFSYKHGDVSHKCVLEIPGLFSVENAMGAVCAADIFDVSYENIRKGLLKTRVKGRMEVVPVKADFTVIIDYAHNAMSSEAVIDMIRSYSPARVIALFGCGGDRAKSRRYEMGEVIGAKADFCIITADNSRFEKTEAIIDDILVGMKKSTDSYTVIPNRKEAIHHALSIAEKNDVVLLMGKGHEEYEEINGERIPFSEYNIVTDYFNKASR